MNDKDVQDLQNKQEKNLSEVGVDKVDSDWLFCPVCGNKIPKIQKLKYCIKCGTNLDYLKESKILFQKEMTNPYVTPTKYPQTYKPPVYYGPKKISDNEIHDTKSHKLWGTTASISVPLGAFLLMNFITAGVLVLIVFSSFNLELLYDFILNPYFLIFSSFFELIFILVPVMYVSKYLENPSLKNRLELLGFTTRGIEKKGILKEVLIGIGFAVVGMLLVGVVAYLTEIALEILFGIEIVSDLGSGTGDVESIISSADILSIILLSIVMILIIGTSEEILFRGFMQKGLMRSLGTKWGILLTAFFFALIHVIGIIIIGIEDPIVLIVSFLLSFIPYFAISLLLGYLYYWRNENLIAVTITHGVYDALTIIMVYILLNVF